MYFLFHPKPYLVNPNAQVGLGLLCLATYARELGADVQVVNAQAWNVKAAVAAVPPGQIVCMSGCLVDGPIIDDIASKLRAKGCYVVVGGPVADSAELGPMNGDVVVVGAGEPFIQAMVSNGERPRGRQMIPYLTDYGAFPSPDRSLLDGHFGGNIYHPKTGRQTPVSTTLLTARGCRFHCAFCRSGARAEFYEYPLARVKAELERIVDLGIWDVRIADDNILARPGRLEALCGLLRHRELKWRASLRSYPNDVSLYQLMAESGCLELNLGVESADPYVLRAIRKGSSVESNERAIRNALAGGIPHVRALFMMGTPGETARTLELNKRWAEAHPDVTICLTAFVPFPGTMIFGQPERFRCRIELDIKRLNFYSYHGDGKRPVAHISIVDGLTRRQLTKQLRAFRAFLEERGQINHG